MLKVVNSLFRAYIGRYRRELMRHYDAPLRLQHDTLAEILRRHADTVIGRQHDFRGLLSDDGSNLQALPLRNYHDHRPLIERTFREGGGILTAEAPDWITTSSGTTGVSKELPISHAAVRDIHLRGSWLSLAILYEKNPDVQVFSKRNLLIGGAISGYHPKAGVPMGDISAIIIRSIPRVMQRFYIPDVETATSGTYEEKIERIAQLAARQPELTVLGGVPTWNLPLYRRVLEIHGGDDMLDVWPDARVFKHGGVNFEPYREQFRRLFPHPDFIFQEIYNATEGFFAVQDDDRKRTMLLLLTNGIYYEFVPWRDYQNGGAEAVDLAGIQTGETYVMLITTLAGLYRYPMGDLIEFTETDPYRLRILGRTQEFINAFGEDLLRGEAEAALMEACKRTGALIREFTAGPEYIELGKRGCHHWVVEFERPPERLALFVRELDRALIDRNYNYAAKRSNDFAIDPPKLTVAPDGFFREWLRDKGKLGGQHKVPRLANHRRYLEDILGRLAG